VSKNNTIRISGNGNDFCLGRTSCVGDLFFVSVMVDKVAAEVISDVETSS
jgi:hypothetical protein